MLPVNFTMAYIVQTRL